MNSSTSNFDKPLTSINIAIPTPKTYEEITYLEWKPITIISFVFVVFFLYNTVFYIRLVVLNELYDKYRICDPIFLFYGKKNSCNTFVENARIK